MRSKSLILRTIGLMVGISLIVAACAPAVPPEGKPAKEEPLKITLASGSMGGTTSLRCGAIAGVMKEWLNMDSTVITYPTMAMIDGLHEGVFDIAGSSYPHVMSPAYAGTGDYAADPYKDLRVLFTAADCPMQVIVPVDSPVQTWRDLIGKRYSPGKKGTLGESTVAITCEILGLSPEEDFQMVYLGHTESGAAMTGGKIDGYSGASAPPQPAFSEVDLAFPVRLVGHSEEDIAAVIKAVPTFLRVEIPAIWYHMDKPVLTFGPLSVVTATDRMPEDIAYGIVKNFIENPEFVGYYHITLKTDIEEGRFKHWVENANVGAPYHIGAYRYFKEVGWNVPAEMVPPEAK